MRISMPRGDLRLIRFLVKNRDGTTADVDFTEIYFTVKKSANDRLFKIQKKLSLGEIIKLGPGDYQFRISPEDTNNMVVNTPRFPSYVFDIQVDYVGDFNIKETFTGAFVLTPEVTHTDNE